MCIKEETKMNELKKYMAERKEDDNSDSHLISILHKAQGLYGYLDKDVMNEISLCMNIPTAHIWGVATFYHYFNLEPIGRYVVSVCLGTACYVKGAETILKAIKNELGVGMGQTTEDKLFTLREARCLGACGLAPVIMIDDKIYGELTAAKTVSLLKKYRAKTEAEQK
ncbi:MAG: NADH-quinone oxidoreductase subunit NuoE [Candidatus Omnitrophota bacterium]